jgi:hypothetical protein
VSERLRSIVGQLNIRPDDRVLEIGCGHGVAAHRDLDRAHALVEPWLAPSGVVSSFFDTPSGGAEAGE